MLNHEMPNYHNLKDKLITFKCNTQFLEIQFLCYLNQVVSQFETIEDSGSFENTLRSQLEMMIKKD